MMTLVINWDKSANRIALQTDSIPGQRRSNKEFLSVELAQYGMEYLG